MPNTQVSNILITEQYSIERPIMMLLVGPNGAGKTTFRQRYLDQNPNFNHLITLNWDDTIKEILRRNPNLSEKTAAIQAGMNIVETQKYCFSQNYGFIYETTGADRRHRELIETAKGLDYKLVTIFIGLKSPELSKKRVQIRVKKGGHDIPVKDIESRYPKIMVNFPNILNQSDTCFVIDNSGQDYRLILLKSNDFNITFSRFPNYLNTKHFNLAQEIQDDGCILLNNKYKNKTPQQKQEIIQMFMEKFSIERT